jgi:hypothetical protein
MQELHNIFNQLIYLLLTLVLDHLQGLSYTLMGLLLFVYGLSFYTIDEMGVLDQSVKLGNQFIQYLLTLHW